MTRTWNPGDRALLSVVVRAVVDEGGLHCVEYTWGAPHYLNVDPADLIPDDRRPSWLPGQPGDVAEFEGQRWGYFAGAPMLPWVCISATDHPRSDDDVPADAVLVLKAKTREVSPVVRVCKCGHGAHLHTLIVGGRCYGATPIGGHSTSGAANCGCDKYEEVES